MRNAPTAQEGPRGPRTRGPGGADGGSGNDKDGGSGGGNNEDGGDSRGTDEQTGGGRASGQQTGEQTGGQVSLEVRHARSLNQLSSR